MKNRKKVIMKEGHNKDKEDTELKRKKRRGMNGEMKEWKTEKEKRNKWGKEKRNKWGNKGQKERKRKRKRIRL